jgi:hypothetical protein
MASLEIYMSIGGEFLLNNKSSDYFFTLIMITTWWQYGTNILNRFIHSFISFIFIQAIIKHIHLSKKHHKYITLNKIIRFKNSAWLPWITHKAWTWLKYIWLRFYSLLRYNKLSSISKCISFGLRLCLIVLKCDYSNDTWCRKLVILFISDTNEWNKT